MLTLNVHSFLNPKRSTQTLVRVRWFAFAGQLSTIVVVALGFGATLPWWPLGALLAILGLSNWILQRKGGDDPVVGGPILCLDVVLLTGLLACAGGPSNPFSVLYLVHVTLAAVMSSRRLTWLIVALSSAGFGLLFWFHVPLTAPLGGHGNHMHHSFSAHLQGMWIAYVIAASAIALFVTQLSDALRHEREQQEQSSRLLGLAALAAGAAHEIGNPLGTIRIAADEVEDELKTREDSLSLLDDIRLIQDEVLRARNVLDRMASAAGELRGEALVAVDLKVFFEEVVAVFQNEDRISLRLAQDLPQVHWPVHASQQALIQIVRNALQASDRKPEPGETPIRIEAKQRKDGVIVIVADGGDGMSREILDNYGQPFFTTRPEQGQGLGAFIARSLVQQMGGRLEVTSRPGEGSQISIWLPSRVES